MLFVLVVVNIFSHKSSIVSLLSLNPFSFPFSILLVLLLVLLSVFLLVLHLVFVLVLLLVFVLVLLLEDVGDEKKILLKVLL